MHDVYAALQDDISKFIFENRIMYSITNDHNYLNKIPEAFFLKEIVMQLNECNPVYLYGAGKYGRILVKHFNFTAAIDKNAKSIKDFPINVITPDEFIQVYQNEYIFISSYSTFYDEIYNNLLLLGIYKDKIMSYFNFYKRQYFDLTELMLNDRDVFVDGGAYDGYTSVFFSEVLNGKHKEIYAFEPNKTLCNKIIKNKKLNNITIINSALYDECTKIGIKNDGGSTKIDNTTSDYYINSITLDSYFANKILPSYIKLDVEGTEMNALRGAQNIIQKNKPKLAVCIYHKHEDIFKIPLFLLKLNPDYKFYIRHYSIDYASEYVLYAI